MSGGGALLVLEWTIALGSPTCSSRFRSELVPTVAVAVAVAVKAEVMVVVAVLVEVTLPSQGSI
mgnify:CR=1 FL=1